MSPALHRWLLPIFSTFVLSFSAAVVMAFFALSFSFLSPIWIGLSLVSALLGGAVAVGFHTRRGMEWDLAA
jgi:hypothetical protein